MEADITYRDLLKINRTMLYSSHGALLLQYATNRIIQMQLYSFSIT